MTTTQRFSMLTGFGMSPRLARTISEERRQPGRMEFVNKTDKTAELLIYEVIGYDWWTDGGMTAQRFADELAALGSIDTLTVRINSPGGDVWDGMTIFNQLAMFEPQVNVQIDGMAASIAALIAMAGDKVSAAEVSQIMIHDAWTGVVGNEQDLREVADILAKIDGQIAETFAVRSTKTADEFRQIMNTDTYFTAAEAKDIGIVDEVIATRKAGDSGSVDDSKSRQMTRNRRMSLVRAAFGA